MRLLSRFQPGVYLFRYPIGEIDINIINNVYNSIVNILPDDVDVLVIPNVCDFQELSIESLVFLRDKLDETIIEQEEKKRCVNATYHK